MAPDVIATQDARAGEALLEWEGDAVFSHEEGAGRVSDRQAGRECLKRFSRHVPTNEKDLGKEKGRLSAELDVELLAEACVGKENNGLGTILRIGPCVQNKRDALQCAVGSHRVNLLCGLIGNMDLGRVAQIEPEGCAVALNQSARGCLDVDHRHTGQGRAPASLSLSFVSRAAYENGLGQQLRLQKQIVPVQGCRSVGKKDMVHNQALPEIEVNPETYVVKANGEILTCEPAQVLPLAQRYFLF